MFDYARHLDIHIRTSRSRPMSPGRVIIMGKTDDMPSPNTALEMVAERRLLADMMMMRALPLIIRTIWKKRK